MTLRPPAIFIRAASHLGPAGFGKNRTGLQPWPADLHNALERREIEAVHWSHLFPSDAQRFARMDPLCRVGLMAVELLGAELESLNPGQRQNVGLAAETAGGCATTDARFLRTPRPSLFTYTLPSTVLGEVSIRHRLQGPLLCLLSPDGLGEQILETAVDWLGEGTADYVVCLCCEAIEPSPVACLPVSLAGAWRADALLLGREGPGAVLDTGVASSVVELCRKLCIDNPAGSLHAGVRTLPVGR